MEEAYQFYIEWMIAVVLGFIIAAIARRIEKHHTSGNGTEPDKKDKGADPSNLFLRESEIPTIK